MNPTACSRFVQLATSPTHRARIAPASHPHPRTHRDPHRRRCAPRAAPLRASSSVATRRRLRGRSCERPRREPAEQHVQRVRDTVRLHLTGTAAQRAKISPLKLITPHPPTHVTHTMVKAEPRTEIGQIRRERQRRAAADTTRRGGQRPRPGGRGRESGHTPHSPRAAPLLDGCPNDDARRPAGRPTMGRRSGSDRVSSEPDLHPENSRWSQT